MPLPAMPGAQALRRGDEASLFQAAPVAMLAIDAGDLRVRRANQAACSALGQSASELEGLRLDALVAPAERGRFARLLSESPATTGLLTVRSAWPLAHRDGHLVRFEVADAAAQLAGRPCILLFQPGMPGAKPDSDAGGKPGFAFAALHDLKEPLHIIKGYLGILRAQSGARLDPEGQECLEQAYGGTLRLQEIVLGLLEYFRTEAKGIRREPVDLGQLADETIQGLSLQVAEAEARIERRPLPTVLADRFQLARVLQNLLSNALKFRAGRPARIAIDATEHPDAWELRVHDDGIGIPHDALDKVLEPFQRLHSVDEYPGTGLGLSISRKVVELHGGRLWLTSELGAGTTAHFTLPKEAAP